MNPVAVEAAARRAVDSIRSRQRPYFLECRTYRFRAHSMFDAQLYRTRQEVELGRNVIRSRASRQWLRGNRMLSPEELARIEAEVDAEIDEAVAFAEAGTLGADRAISSASSRRETA